MMSKLRELLDSIKKNPEFIRITTGGGKNSPGPMRERIEFVQKRVEYLLKDSGRFPQPLADTSMPFVDA